MKTKTNKYASYLIVALWILLAGCDATKHVADGSYLLNKVDIKTDTKGVGKSDLKPYLRQKPNSSVFLLGKVRLHMYNIAENDSTWLNRQLKKYGEAPVLYSDRMTGLSMEQLRLHLSNKGFLNAEVDTTVIKKNKKAHVTYRITGNKPYLIRNVGDTVRATDTTIYNILKENKKLDFIKEKARFDLEELEKARVNMTAEVRNNGYYNFSKEHLYYLADTCVGNHQVDITLGLNNPTDSTTHQRFRIGDVYVFNGVDPLVLADSNRHYMLDTVSYRTIHVVSSKKRLLLPQAIYYNTFIRPGRLFSDKIVERTYSSLNTMGPIAQTAVALHPIVRNDSNFLNADITITPGNLHYMQFGLDGTNTAGDLGIASNVTYEHRNIFKGGEQLRVRLNGAYEFISASDSANLLEQSYYEYGSEVFLSVPQLLLPWIMKRLKDQPSASTEFSVGATFQKRPEYLRQFFHMSSKFQWARMDWRLMNVVKPLAITYVRMPWKSQRFIDHYLNEDLNPILKASYEQQLIVLSSYEIAYTNIHYNHIPKFPFRIRAGIEVAGHLPRLVSAMGGSKIGKSGKQEIFRIPYAEYVKSDFDFAPTYAFDHKNVLAAHIAIGVAYPYGNSSILPFEKRYFSGGANSVRGWSTRTLGPGVYNRDVRGYDFARKVGDIKLDMSVEFRRKLNKLFELATFVDAGNNWTIKEYEEQPGGYFQFNSFYKELALAYGLGLRLNLNFLVLRLDAGMKAHNPGLPKNERWTIFKPQFKRDFALHFAIGYPF